MLKRSIMVAIPGAALAVVAFAMVGPGAPRPFAGVRIWGGPTEDVRSFCFRLEIVQRFQGIDSLHDIGEIEVLASAQNGQAGVFRGPTHPDGTADVQIPLPSRARGTVYAVVRTVDGRPLLEGEIAHGLAGWGESRSNGPVLAGQHEGDLTVTAATGRGMFATPFRDDLLLRVQHRGLPAPGASVTVEADGADLDAAPGSRKAGTVAVVTRPNGTATIGVIPASYDVEVAIEARALGLSGRWHGPLPVTPGAMWLEPDRAKNGPLRVVSPVPRAVAYATIATRTERLWGGQIALFPDAAGFSSGSIGWPLRDDFPAPAWLTLASDPRATGSGTVGWPIQTDPTQPTDQVLEERHFPDLLLLDGMPQAEHREILRRHQARNLGIAALVVAALLEILLLADAARSAERALRRVENTIAESGNAGGAVSSARPGRGKALFSLVIAAAVVLIAFASIGVVLLWKTGG
jgi:hypothetical protein